MVISEKNVFLVSGRRISLGDDGIEAISSVVEQCVVVAPSELDVYPSLEKSMPNFRPIGFASLSEYEDAAARIRACLRGEEVAWNLVLANGMSVA